MNTRKTERDLWSMSGMTIAATSTAVASFSGLRGLASAAGWPEHLAWLLPVTVDTYAMTSTRLWLAGGGRHRRARRKYRTESEPLEAARAADRRHRAKHGRPISRDALRVALKISGSRATELRRSLAPAAYVPNEKEVANQR